MRLVKSWAHEDPTVAWLSSVIVLRYDPVGVAGAGLVWMFGRSVRTCRERVGECPKADRALLQRVRSSWIGMA